MSSYSDEFRETVAKIKAQAAAKKKPVRKTTKK